jgi:hypothetical protein
MQRCASKLCAVDGQGINTNASHFRFRPSRHVIERTLRMFGIPPAKAATYIYRYRASLQLFAAVNAAGIRSCPQIERPARRGAAEKAQFRSSR